MKSVLLLFPILIYGLASFSQGSLQVRGDLDPAHLIKNILLSKENTMEVFNVHYQGAPYALGGFADPSKYNIIKKGLILSTGHVNSALGPNTLGNASTRMQMPGNAALSKLSGGPTFDACMLSFDFIAPTDTIRFRYFFGSEEYPEYVNKDVNDIFTFDLIDLQTGETKNLAVIGPERDMVTVDHVNKAKNAAFYIENDYWRPSNLEKYRNDRGRGELSYSYQFDGFTTILVAGSKVIPGKKYRIVFGIADVGDDIYDSAVFLEAGSFETGKPPTTIAKEAFREIESALTNQSVGIIRDQNELILRLNLPFAFDSDEIEDATSINQLNKIAAVLKNQPSIALRIEGHTDGMGSDEYNADLSERRAAAVLQYLTGQGLANSRMESIGLADNVPISDNITQEGRAKNRRVEIHLSFE